MKSRFKIIIIIVFLLSLLGIGVLSLPLTLSLYHQVQGGQVLNSILKTNIDQPALFACDWMRDSNPQQREQIGRAITHLKRAITYRPSLAQAYFQLGQSYCLLDEPQKAVDYLTRYTKLRPKNPLGYLELGFAYENTCLMTQEPSIEASRLELRQPVCHDSAAQDVLLKTWRESHTASDFLKAGEQYQNNDQLEVALVWYKRSTWLEIKWHLPWYLMGQIYQQQGDTQNALLAYEQAITRSPKDILALYAAGEILLNASNADSRAIQIYEKIAEIDPLPIKALLNLGKLYERNNQMAAALSSFQKAVQLSYQVTGKTNEAYWERHWPHYILGDFYLRHEQFNQAQEVFQEAILIDTANRYIDRFYWGLGKVALAQNRLIEASDYLNKAISSSKSPQMQAQIYLSRADLALKNGDKTTAINFLRQALSLQPENKWIHRRLASTLRAAGYYKDAIIEYEKYLAKWPDDTSILKALEETRQALQNP